MTAAALLFGSGCVHRMYGDSGVPVQDDISTYSDANYEGKDTSIENDTSVADGSLMVTGSDTSADSGTSVETDRDTSAKDDMSNAREEDPVIPGLTWTGSMPLQNARQFRVDYYGDDYSLITIHDQFYYLLVEEGADIPKDLPEDIQVLRKPLTNIYASSSSCPDFFRELGCIGQVTMTSTKAEDWTIPEIREIVQKEEMIYVGKYSAPDYEYICDEGCSLAIENTMIYHAPEVREMLLRLGIPVLTEYSSYEDEPLGRLEWIMLYGLLTGTEQKAREFFDEQVLQMNEVLNGTQTGSAEPGSRTGLDSKAEPGSGTETDSKSEPGSGTGSDSKAEPGCETETDNDPGAKGRIPETSVVFFYIGTNGSVNVRREKDYVTRMIDMAGGKYILQDLEEALPESDSGSGSITVQMESFYAAARDADVLIYNGTLGESLETLDEFLQKSPMLKQFAAVKSGRVYCSQESLFQEVTGTCRMVVDFNRVIRSADGESDEDLTYLKKLI